MATPHSIPTCKTAEPTTGGSDREVLLHELAALRRSEAVLRDFIETSTIGLHWLGADGTILWVNQAELDLLGYSGEEYVGRNIAEFHADESVINDILGRLSRGETLSDYPAQLCHYDGTIRHVLINSSVLFEDGKFVHTRCFTRDVTALKREQEVHRMLAAIVDSSDDAIFSKNLDGAIESWNAGAEKVFGYPAEEIIGKPLSVLLPPDRRSEFPDILARIRAAGHLTHHDVILMSKDGRRVNVSLTISPVRDSVGHLVGSSAIARDITDRMQADAALRQSEERFRLAIKATNDAIWDLDLKTGVVGWNELYSTLYGRPPETSNSWQWWIDRIHPDDREHTVQSLRAAISSDASSWTGEYRFRRASGAWADIYDRAYISRDASGEAWRVIGAMQDLTDRKQAQANLRESEERFRRVFEEGPLGVALVGSDHRFLKVNSALCQMIGYSETELVQKTFAEITHPDDVQADVELAGRLFRREIPFYRMQKRYMKKNGEIIWINLTATLILNSDGQPLYGLGMMEDVTELKRTQEEAFARQKLESVGTLASGIAHDFNNILGAVGVQAEVALKELDAGSSCRGELKAICEVAKRGSEIVRELMIYAGKESEAVEWVDLSKIVEEMLALLKVSVSKHAVMNADLRQDLPAIRSSAAQLRQIVMNLITNASDAIGDRDGVIRVATRRVTQGADSATVSGSPSEGDYVALEVSDTGGGMSRETKDRIFDPFFTTKAAGRGLGLAVVSGIVRGLGGAIRLTSELGKGTWFQILLPCAYITRDAAFHSMPSVEEPAGPSHAAILVVEDEEVLRQAIVKTLRMNGFDVFDAADGSLAIDLLRANGNKINAILLDMTISGAASREVLAEAAKIRRDIRVVLTSEYSQEIVLGATNGPQISSFIRKPFQLAHLVKTLRSAMAS